MQAVSHPGAGCGRRYSGRSRVVGLGAVGEYAVDRRSGRRLECTRVERCRGGCTVSGRVRLVVNPIAGAGLSTWVLPLLVRRLTRLGLSCEVVRTFTAADARQAAGDLRGAYHALVVLGGDGTVREAIAGLTRRDVPVGIVPLGTANVLARELRLPIQPERAARVIAERTVRWLDLGEANGRPFFLMAGVGFDAEVTARVHASRRGAITVLNYFPALIGVLLRYRFPAIRVTVDGRPVGGEANFVVVSNTRRYGGRLVMALDAAPDDGWLDVCLYRIPQRRAALSLFVRFLTHRRPDRRRATFLRARRVEVTGDGPVPYQLDGDPFGTLPVTVRVEPRAVPVIVPEPTRWERTWRSVKSRLERPFSARRGPSR